MDPAESAKVLSGFAWFTLGIGALLLLFGAYFIFSASKSYFWPSVEGKITSVEVRKHFSRTGTSTSRSRARSNKGITYYYQVSYNYVADGTGYSGSRYSLGTGNTVESRFKTEELARERADTFFKKGDKIKVYFDPNDPASSVLSRGLNTGTYAPALLGLFFLAAGVLFKVILKTNS